MKAKFNYTCADGTELEIIGCIYLYPNDFMLTTLPNNHLIREVKAGSYISIATNSEGNTVASYILPYNDHPINIVKLEQESDITYNVKEV